MHYIYLITNKVSGKQYVGQSKDPNARWKQHMSASHTSRGALARAIRKYGRDAFNFEVMVSCTKEEVDDYEEMFIELYGTKVPNGYNIRDAGQHKGFSNLPPEYDSLLGRPRSRKELDGDLEKFLYRHRVREFEGYVVRVPNGPRRSFMSSKFSMEQKLEAARAYLRDQKIEAAAGKCHDASLPKFVQKSKDGFRVEWRENGRALTKTFGRSIPDVETRKRLACEYAQTLRARLNGETKM